LRLRIRLALAAFAVLAPAASLAQSSAIRQFEERVKRDPLDGISSTILADLYLRQARQTGDLGAYEKADGALQHALQLQPGDPGASASKASLLYSEHRFTEALDLASSVYQKDSRFLQALVTVADAQMSLGRYADAEKTYQELSGKNSTPPLLARIAYLEFLKGNTEQAITLMLRATEQRRASDEASEGAAWYELRLGDLYLSAGRFEDANQHYQEALVKATGYDRAMAEAGLGNVLAAQGDLASAIAAYERAVRLHPQPSLLANLGDLYQKGGRLAEAQRQYEAVRLLAASAPLNESVYMRELAVFLSDHDMELPRALDLARRDWAARQDIYGADTLAWALYKNGRVQEAADALQLIKYNTQDAKLYYHAGLIWKAHEDPARARDSLEKALAINPHFSILQADDARKVLDEIKSPLPNSNRLLIGVVLVMVLALGARWAMSRRPLPVL